MSPFDGMKIIETPSAYDPVLDWSGCRSISRAIRRAKRGYPQRTVIRAKPKAFMLNGVVYAHPAIVAELRKQSNLSPVLS